MHFNAEKSLDLDEDINLLKKVPKDGEPFLSSNNFYHPEV